MYFKSEEKYIGIAVNHCIMLLRYVVKIRWLDIGNIEHFKPIMVTNAQTLHFCKNIITFTQQFVKVNIHVKKIVNVGI